MEKRAYNADVKLSVVGFGGIIVKDVTTEEAASYVKEARKRGVNYFDVAPTYGNAEEMLGPALEPYRDEVFLACKTTQRDAENAKRELHESLEKLRTDHFDLYQLHSVTTMEDVEKIFSKGGALETFIDARAQGLTKYLGFSAHSEEAALALMDRFDFDSILFPLNWVTWNEGGFGPDVVKVAKQKNMGILALKALAKRRWKEDEDRGKWTKTWYHPVDSYEEAKRGLHFTLSVGATAAVSPGHIELFRWACDAAEELEPIEPMGEEQREAVAAAAEGLAYIFPQDYR
jgi:aryl-alcohol dehydrogenase-like predicted oxidoreductase